MTSSFVLLAQGMAAPPVGRPRRRSSSESTSSVGSANSIPASPSLSPRAVSNLVRHAPGEGPCSVAASDDQPSVCLTVAALPAGSSQS